MPKSRGTKRWTPAVMAASMKRFGVEYSSGNGWTWKAGVGLELVPWAGLRCLSRGDLTETWCWKVLRTRMEQLPPTFSLSRYAFKDIYTTRLTPTHNILKP